MREVKGKSIFAASENTAAPEDFATLIETNAVRIERIVSHSHSSPPGFWYDQAEDEWVMIVQGSADLEFSNGEIVELHEGDYLFIPRHIQHRVARTSETTIWLAVHVK